MVAVVYSGSKAAHWKIAREGKTVAECTMPGINPCHNNEKTILDALNKKSILINNAERIKKIYVFSSGASSEARSRELALVLSKFFKYSEITVKDDLYGAAVAACYNNSGIVAVLGSGSNCAYFNGTIPKQNNFGLGFILGDEGSSIHLGKTLLKKFIQGKLPKDLHKAFTQRSNLDRPLILEKIYRKPMPEQFLSSFFDFFVEHRSHPAIQEIIDQGFDQFIKTYLLPTIKEYPEQEIHFVGSVAGQFEDRLLTVAQKNNINITTIIKEPIYNLLNYYSN
jgi:N-acetylglucosamine kinase-like BadF-type ATPase